MASRPLIAPHRVIEDQSMAASFTSEVTIISNVSIVSYTAVWSAGSTPVGTLVVEVSNDYKQNSDGSIRDAGNWRELPSTMGAVTGNTGVGYIDVALTGAYSIRLKYTRTSGSGTLIATLMLRWHK